MDELDRKIISLLEGNGRASNARIARDVGVSEGTVRRRLKRLISEQIINVVALPDPRKLGYESEALIGVQVDPDKIDAVAAKMANLEHTRWVTVTTGTYDVFAWATLPNAESPRQLLYARIRRKAHIAEKDRLQQTLHRKDVDFMSR